MAFRIITGSMGSGKSYMGAELLLKYLEEGAWVHTNIDLVQEEVERRGYAERVVMLQDDPETWQTSIYGAREGQENLVVIDEGMLKFDAHEWQVTRKKYKVLLEFLIWSRKFGLDVYLIGQAQKGMDVTFTRIALEVIACSAVKEYPLLGPILCSIRGDFRRKFKNPNGTATGQVDWVKFRPEVGSFYKTESTHGRFEDQPRMIGRAPRNEAARRRRSWAVLLGFVFVLCTAFFLASRLLKRVLQGRPEEVAAAPQPSAPKRVEPVTLATQPPAPPAAPLPDAARVWGTADWGTLTFWEAATGVKVTIGGIIDDAEILAIDMSRRMFRVRLDDGRILRFRPATRADAPKPSTNNPAPWNKPFSLPSFPSFSSSSEAATYGAALPAS